ncbi:pol polyprotein [Tanacetum coccineum]
MLKSKFDMKDMGLAEIGDPWNKDHNELIMTCVKSKHIISDKILNTHNSGGYPAKLELHLTRDCIYLKKRLRCSQLEYSKDYWHVNVLKTDEITYVREKWGRFEGNCGGAIPKSSCRTRLVLSSRTSRLLRSRRLCISQGKVQRVTPTYPMQDLTAEILPKFSGVFDRSPFMWGIIGALLLLQEASHSKLCPNGVEMINYRDSKMTNTQTPPTVVNTTGAPVTNAVANHAEKPEKFNGQNFKRWQQKMFFYLTTLGLARFLKETAPQVEPPAEGQSSNAQAVQAVEAWKHSDFLCHNYVLNGLIDPLYNVYCKTTTAKELWESLERKYKTEDAGTKKFVVARFLDYKMVDSKSVVSQVQDLQVLLHDIHAEGMTLSETFQVAAIIEKLPPSWVEFKNYLKHKRKEMSVEDLVVRLRIEEDNKLAQKDTYTPDSAKANMVEHAGSSSRFNSKGNKKDKRKNDKKGKGKSEYLAPKAGIVKQKFQGTCYNCDQPGHRAANCKMPKRRIPLRQICGWWIDTGATRHVCADKSMFHSFRAVDNGQKLYMGNSATADIKGEGDVILKMTSEKELKLTNVERMIEEGESVLQSPSFMQTWIRHEFTAPYSPQQNGIARKEEPYLKKEMVTAMLISSGMTGNVGGKPFDGYLSFNTIPHDKVVQDKNKRDDNDPKMKNKNKRQEEVEPRRSKRGKKLESLDHILLFFYGRKMNPHLTENGTRPDLAYAVSRLSRYTSNPSYAHWKAITRVLHYLRYSRDYGLHYDRHPAVIEGYSDANWISDIKDSRSTSGYVFTLGGAAISWKSSKQTVIAKSTMESEFIALDKCGEEAEWLRQFVEDIPRWPKPVTAISIHCDSKSAMGRAKSTMYNGKSRHIRRRHNSIRQLLSTGVISIDYVASKDNIADPFTKGLSRELVSKSSKGMGLKPLKE